MRQLYHNPPLFNHERDRMGQLLSVIILITVFLSSILALAIVETAIPGSNPLDNPGFRSVMLAIIGMSIPFYLNRRGHVIWASRLYVYIFFVTIFVIVLVAQKIPHEAFIKFYIVPLTLGSLLLRRWEAMLLIGLEIVSISIFPLLLTEVTYPDIVSEMAFILLAGSLIQIVVYYRTMMEREQVRISKENEQRYRIMFDSKVHAVLVHDGKQVLLANRSTAALGGYDSPDKLIGKSFPEFIHPDDLAMVAKRANQRLASPDQIPPDRYEIRVMGIDGKTRWIDAQSDVIILDNQKVTMVHAIDITARRQFEEELRQQNAYLETLHQTALTLMNRLELPDLLRHILKSAAGLVEAHDGFVYLVDETHTKLERHATLHDYAPDTIPDFAKRGEGLSGRVWESEQTMVINDYDHWAGRRENYPLGLISAIISVPLIVNKRVQGVLALTHQQAGKHFSPKEQAVIERFANLAAIAVDNAFLYQMLEKQTSFMSVTNTISSALVTMLDFQELLDFVTAACCQLVNATSAYISTWDFEHNESTVLAEYVSPNANEKEQESDLGITYLITDEFAEVRPWINGERKHVLYHVDDETTDAAERAHIEAYGGHTALQMPMIVEDKPVAILEIWESRFRREFTRDELDLLQSICNQVAVVYEKSQLYSALRSSEERNRNILNALPDLILRIKRDGTYVDFSQTGINPDDVYRDPQKLIGQNMRDVLPRERYEAGIKAITQCLDTNTIQMFEFTGTYRNKQQHFEARFIKSGDDETIVFVRNITDRADAQQRDLALKLERERVRLLEDFISDASHDLKTPLTNLKSRMYLLRKAKDDEKRERQIQVIESEVDRLHALISDLLTMTLLDSGEEPLELEALDLTTVLREVYHAHTTTAENKGLALNLEIAGTLPRIKGDGGELYRVVANLLTNAISYTSEGSVTLKAHVDGNQKIIMEVIDTGMGIDADSLPHIFDRFYRADSARNTEKGGTGLGLAIAKKIIDLHNGSIHVESETGHGTTFQVQLPIEVEING